MRYGMKLRAALAPLLVMATVPLTSSAMAGETPVPTAAEIAKLQFKDVLRWPQNVRFVALRSADKFAPFNVVRAAKPFPLPVGKPLKITFKSGEQTYNEASFMKATAGTGLLILHDGKIVMERYASGRTAKDLWTAFSITKSVTSTLLGAAVKDGLIKSLDDKMSDYIPELKGSIYDRISIRHTLMMASGVYWNEDYTDPTNDINSLWEKGVVENMKDRKLVSEPGTKFLYRTGDSNLLGVLVSRVTGMPLSAYLSKKIWTQYGMETDAKMQLVNGEELGGGGLSMTLRDFGRFAQFFMNGGKAGGKSVLPDNWTTEATTPYLPTGFMGAGYGYQWWVPKGGEAYMGIGIYGQTMYINPKKKLVVVFNSAWPAADYDLGYQLQAQFAEAVEKQIQ